MNQQEMFNGAKWIGYNGYTKKFMGSCDVVPYFPIIRAKFKIENLSKIKSAILKIVGLGFFEAKINGKKISEDLFLPLSTDYEKRENHPVCEELFGHRLYVPIFNIQHLLRDGENVLTILFGGGWYTFTGGWYSATDNAKYQKEWFGYPKAIYDIEITSDDKKYDIVSSEKDKICDSFIKTYHLTNFENHNYMDFNDNVFEPNFDDAGLKNAQIVTQLDTVYETSSCPFDRVQSEIKPKLIKVDNNRKVYDTMEDATYIPVLKITAKSGEKVTARFSEEKTKDGDFHDGFCFKQSFSVVSDGKEREVSPHFTWFACRYIEVTGDAELVLAKKVHTDVKVNSTFESDNDLLNYIYKIYLNTQLCNMHAGIPSDCPHIERRGYTGDGELTAPSAMATLDAKEFYKKWIRDISDCQDTISGHVQYTAPYTKCGGGPGAWGCAIVEVPYRYYKEYGDISFAKEMYPQMMHYFDFMESHSENNLVTRDIPNEWCLGDWLPPESVAIPAPLVNNYYYIRSMQRVIEIGKLIGITKDIPMLEKRIEDRKRAIISAYYGMWNGSFVGGLQGANAFAVDLELDKMLSDDRIYPFMLKKIQSIGRFDTGICGTDVLTKVLFSHGDGQTAMDLILSKDPVSFNGFKMRGSTTIGESWPNTYWDRSRFHPMFGAVVAYFYQYLLGITQTDNSAGYEDLVIAPVLCSQVTTLSGSRYIPSGKVSVSYKKIGEKVKFKIILPQNKTAKFIFNGTEKNLTSGENEFTVLA